MTTYREQNRRTLGRLADAWDDTDWHDRAACRGMDTDLFFSHRNEDQELALAACTICPVRVECDEWARESRVIAGIWGGKIHLQKGIKSLLE